MIKHILTIIIFLFSFSQIAFADTIYFYHTDPAGTPIAMTDASGSVVWKADYKPFGEEWSITSNIENNKRFVGKEKDTETGLNYFGARYMLSSIGRFISTDPVGPVNPATGKINKAALLNPQKLNQYAYALNNPYKYVDSNGNWPWEIHDKIIQAAFSGGTFKLTETQRDALGYGSDYVDRDQSSSYKHAMTDLGQTPGEANIKMEAFISERVNKFKELMLAKKEWEAYHALGQAMHPLMDQISPSHEGFQTTYGSLLSNLFKAINHASQETEISDERLGMAGNVVHNFIKKYDLEKWISQ